jgi:hypothetical protein
LRGNRRNHTDATWHTTGHWIGMVRFPFVRLVTQGDEYYLVCNVSNPCLIGVRTLAGCCLDAVQAQAQACLANSLSSLRGKACHEK